MQRSGSVVQVGGSSRLTPVDLRAHLRLVASAAWLPTSLFTLGLLVRLIVWWQHRGYDPFGDEEFYYQGAVTFAQTGTYTDPPTPAWLPIQRVPLFSLLIGAVFRVAGIDLGPVNLFQIAFSLGTCWFIWRWAARLWGETAGRWALGIAVFFPTFITHPASFLYSDTVFTFLAALSLYLLSLLVAPTTGTDGAAGMLDGRWPALTRRTVALALLSGSVAGIAALTRSAGLTLAGIGVLWLILIAWRHPQRVAALSLALIIGFTVTIAPWTIRNYQTYGGFLLLDTIGAYNLWDDNNFEQEAVAAEVGRLKNPVEQQRLATERALRVLRAHPDRFLAKLPGATLDLWHLELDSYARGGGVLMNLTNRAGSFGWVIVADVAYLVVTGFALLTIGLMAGRGGAATGRPQIHLLLLLWIGINLVSGVVYHTEARYRIPYLPQLIVFAALAPAAWPSLLAHARRLHWRSILAGLLLIMLVAGAWSPRLLPVLQMQAWVTAGQLLGAWQPATALAAYERAVAAFPTSDRPLVILGDARVAAGDRAGAIEAYRAALAIEPYNINASLPLVYLYQQTGQSEEAQRILKASRTSDTDLVTWAWTRDIAPPASSLDIGNGFDFGYVKNVYPPERNASATYRWTNGQGLLRLLVPGGGAQRLVLQFNGTRLTQPPASGVEIVINNRVVDRIAATGDWQMHTVDLAALDLGLLPGQTVLLEIRSDTFIPAQHVPGNRDSRHLGVAIDTIAIEAGP